MKYLIKTGRFFYSLALIGYGIHQFYFGSFRNVFFSPYQAYLPLPAICAYAFGILLVTAGVLIIIEKKAKTVSVLLGLLLLILFFGTHIPYLFISEPNKLYHQGLWVNQLKEIALAGGAFVVAGSFAGDTIRPGLLNSFSKVIPYGNLFFLFTVTVFGTGHLVYIEYTVMPGWVHDKIYWAYFTGVALIASGVSIALGIRIRPVALLQAIMIFAWVWLIHLPSAIAAPLADRGNLVASMFDALAFSGTSLLIAFTMKEQKWVNDIENWK